MTYAEKLQDPKWQKKRLSVFERDNYTCQLCFDTETTLHIHHKYYQRDKEPWDYDDEDLITYCKHCHALVEYKKTDLPDCQEIHSVFKYSAYKPIVVMFAMVSNLKNEKVAVLLEYNETKSDIEYIIGFREHMIDRIKFEFETINQIQNAKN